MHSAVALAQLTGTVVMAILRAWVRRGLSESPVIQYKEVPKGREQDWLAMYLGKCKEWHVQAGFQQSSTPPTELEERNEKMAEVVGVMQTAMKLHSQAVKQRKPWPDGAGSRKSTITLRDPDLEDEHWVVGIGQRVMKLRAQMAKHTSWGSGREEVPLVSKVIDHAFNMLIRPENDNNYKLLSIDEEVEYDKKNALVSHIGEPNYDGRYKLFHILIEVLVPFRI
jgi:hypothetical protein